MVFQKRTTIEYEVDADEDQTKIVLAREPDGNVSFSMMPKMAIRNDVGQLTEYARICLSLSPDEATSLIEALTAVLRDDP